MTRAPRHIPAPRTAATAAAIAALAVLAGCAADQGTGLGARPVAKPDMMTAAVPSPGTEKLGQARVSTKSGEILILEPDGSVSTMQLDTPQGRDAFLATQADLSALDFGGAVIGAGKAKGDARSRAAEQAIAEFAALSQPALPEWRAGTEIDPADFLGVRVAPLGEGRSDLVEVTANLREGVDADLAFSYATCALAGWAKENGTGFARHIRTLQDRRDGKLLAQAAYTLSDARPLGLRVMETNTTLRECRDRGIPAA